MTKLVLKIGKQKAFPDFCPVCGASSAEAGIGAKGLDVLKALKSVYGSAPYVASELTWGGYRQWLYVCDHGEQKQVMRELLYGANPFLKMIKKTPSFEGKYFHLPVRCT
jgi:hypothetical protein